MACSQCQGIESFFGARTAARQLKRYRKSGPDRTTRLLIEALAAEGVDGMTLLDIGGGIGALQLGLLRAGVSHAIDVEASTAYLNAARSEAELEGLAEHIEYRCGDFVALADDVPSADIVTLDRVICCYPDVQALVGQSSVKAVRFYGVVYPRDTWLAHAFIACANIFMRIQRSPFRVFVHPTATVETLVGEHGLVRRFYRQAGFWQVVVYARQ